MRFQAFPDRIEQILVFPQGRGYLSGFANRSYAYNPSAVSLLGQAYDTARNLPLAAGTASISEVRYKDWGDADTHTFAKNANVWGTRLERTKKSTRRVWSRHGYLISHPTGVPQNTLLYVILLDKDLFRHAIYAGMGPYKRRLSSGL